MTDKNFRPCKCGYQICLFCYNKIKDNHNGACPACRHGRALCLPHSESHPVTWDLFLPLRTPYDEANAVFVTPDPSECVATNSPQSCGTPPDPPERVIARKMAFRMS